MIAGLTALTATLLAMAVIGGAVVAVSARRRRLAVLGLLVALLAAPFVAMPLPDLRGVAGRLAGAVLAAYPLLMVSRGGAEPATGSRAGWPVDVLLAATAGVAAVAAALGWDVASGLGTGGLPDAPGLDADAFLSPFLPAVAAGAALVVLAAGPVSVARDPFRLTIGLCLGILGLTLLQVALAGPPSAFADLCVALLLATIAGGGALLARGARQAAAAFGDAGPSTAAGAVGRSLADRTEVGWVAQRVAARPADDDVPR